VVLTRGPQIKQNLAFNDYRDFRKIFDTVEIRIMGIRVVEAIVGVLSRVLKKRHFPGVVFVSVSRKIFSVNLLWLRFSEFQKESFYYKQFHLLGKNINCWSSRCCEI